MHILNKLEVKLIMPAIMKTKFIWMAAGMLLTANSLYSQERGINQDPEAKKIGEIPYEMKDRKDNRVPLATFDDCTKWQVTADQAEVKLYRTREERVVGDYSGKVVYRTKSPAAGFRVELVEPILLGQEWDCINFWNYGDHWLWGEPSWTTALAVSAIVTDAQGKEHIMPFVQAGYGNLCHKYWFLNHLKLIEDITFPATFKGFLFSGKKTIPDETHTLYLGPVYVYKEEFKPMTFKPLPAKMPFPLRKQTILPVNKTVSFKNQVKVKAKAYQFIYDAPDAKLVYEVNTARPVGGTSVIFNGKSTSVDAGAEVIFEDEAPVEWKIVRERLVHDTLFIAYQAVGKNFTQNFDCSITIKQKSLIRTIIEKADTGRVAEIRLGATGPVADGKLVSIPMLVYNYGSQRPDLLSAGNLFYFTLFDWYYTNSSLFFQGNKGIRDGYANYNGGVRYIPLINGYRNPVRERLFINVSPDVHEVFPTIDNPGSPMRSQQADRLWAINGGSDLDALGKFVTGLRSRGVEKVSIRYHEDFWREGGESYTFRLDPNPQLGREKIREYIRFVKSNDWRVGLYSNYTDFATVNALWNEDWVKRGPRGEWEVSWSRCYSPKPSIAWEQEAILAPQIQQIYGSNHSYCDVHTAISPMSRVDYDFRAPGAGKFRSVFEYYGLLLLNERKAYQGPVYSEGGNHWWYAGLLDGNYANGNLNKMVVFPDFQLLKIHPLEMDAANTGEGHEYIAYALAYGNIGILSSGRDAIRRYAFLQPLQDSYSMIPLNEIAYFDGVNYCTGSEAIKKDLISAPQIRLNYSSGLMVYVNFSETPWKIDYEGQAYQLPKHGVLAGMPGTGLLVYSIENPESGNGHRLDRVCSDDLHYLDTHGETVGGMLAGKGSYLLKREKFAWEIIPVEDIPIFDFDLSLIGLKDFGVDIQAVDEKGNILKKITEQPVFGRIKFGHNPDYYKYVVCPVTSIKN
jgi:hypothetical protein